MKIRAFILAICLWVIAPLSFSQNLPPFGEGVDSALLEIQFDQDSMAPAAILIDHYSSRFETKKDLLLETFHRRRIKFYGTPTEDWANVEIPFYVEKREKEDISEIEACVWVIEDGKKSQYILNPEDIFTEEKSEHWHIKKFALPKVVKGAVIEYRYKRTSPYYQTFEWDIQQDLPVRWSEFQLDLPSFLHYRTKKQHLPDFAIEQVKRLSKTRYLGNYSFYDTRHRWAIKNIPAFYEEPFITTAEDYLIKMAFQRGSEKSSREDEGAQWHNFANRILGEAGEWDNFDKKTGQERILPFVKNLDGEAKARKIYELVCSQMSFNGNAFPIPSKDTKELLKEGTGNCTDINLWLCNMLRAAKFDAHPVLLSTRSHGRINESYPFLTDFNFTIVYLEMEGKSYLLDATSTFLPFGMIRPSCMNGKGLIMIKDKSLWANLDRGLSGISRIYVKVQFQAEEEKFVAQVRQVYNGFDAVLLRDLYFEDTETFRTDLMDGEASNIEVKNEKEISRPFEIAYQAEWPANISEDHIYISPFFLTQLSQNPFMSTERSFPMDFNYQNLRSVFFTLEIPEGYEVEISPQKMSLTVANSKVKYSVNKVENGDKRLQILEEFHILESLISPDYYQEVKGLYDERVKKNAEQIVLKKKP